MDKPYLVDAKIDRNSSVPLYQQISDPLEAAINSGELGPGELVEDEISMSKRLQVSRPTARRALQELVNRGLLTRRRGVGTRVTPNQIHRPLALSSLKDDLVKAGFTPTTRVLSYEIIEATDKETEMLGIEPGAGVVLMSRLRMVDGQPLAILKNYIPLPMAPAWEELQDHGLYECFAKRGVKIHTAAQVIGARAAEAEEAQLLGENVKAPLLTMERTAYTEDGTLVECGRHVYRPSLYSFRFTVFA